MINDKSYIGIMAGFRRDFYNMILRRAKAKRRTFSQELNALLTTVLEESRTPREKQGVSQPGGGEVQHGQSE